MKKIIRLILVLIILAMLVAAVSCSKSEMPEKQILDNVYKIETFALPEGMEYANSLFETSDGYIIYGQLYDEETGYSNKFARLDENFAMVGEYFDIGVELDENSWMGDIQVADDGTCYTTISSNYYDEETGYYESKYYLAHLDSEYKIIKQVLTTELLGLDPTEYAYIYNLTPISKGRLAFVSNDIVYVVDADMNIIFKKTVEDLGAAYMNAIIDTERGLLIIYNDLEYNSKAVLIDTETMSVSEPYDFTGLGYGQYFGAKGEYDIYYIDEAGIYGYNIETKTSEQLLNYMNSDLMDFYPNSLIAEEDHSFICTSWDYSSSDASGMVIMRLSPVADEEIKPKYLITLGALYMNYNIRNQVYNFNRANDEYRIVLKDYSEGIDYSEESEYTYEDAITKLNGDIASGNVPDLLVCSTEIPFDSYSSKGLFADLYEYIDNDEELDRSMFEPSVLKAYQTGDKLYRIASQYSVRGFMGKSDIVGAYKDNWNTDAFLSLANSLPEDSSMFQDMTRSMMMDLFINGMYDEFIDVSTGKCNFTDGTFENILEYAATLSETSIFDNLDYSNVDNDFWLDYENAYYEGRAVLAQTYVSSFADVISTMNYTFRTDEVEFLGYPTKSGNPIITDDSASIAMSSKSKLKDGAWAFISSLLSPEYQDKLDWGLPVLSSSLEKIMNDQIKADQERKKRDEEYANGDIIGGTIIRPMVEAAVAVDMAEDSIYPNLYLDENYANKILEFIRSADMLARYDDKIMEIINEEAGRFFEGQCTSNQAANAVQSRVSIYVSENS